MADGSERRPRGRGRGGLARSHARSGRSRRLHRRPHGPRRRPGQRRPNGWSTSTASTPTSPCWRRPSSAGPRRLRRDQPRRRGRRPAAPPPVDRGAWSGLGGDARARARELDLLRFQVGELDEAAVDRTPTRTPMLAEEEDWLADAGRPPRGGRRRPAAAGRRTEDGLRAAVPATCWVGPWPPSPAGRRSCLWPGRLQDLDAELEDLSRELRPRPRASRTIPGAWPRSGSGAGCCAS